MAVPTVRSQGTMDSDTTAAITPSQPLNSVNGDLLICVIEGSQTNTAALNSSESSSAGWVRIFRETEGDGAAGVVTLEIWAWVMDGTFGGTWQDPTAQNHIHGRIVAIQTGTHGVTNPATDIVVGTGAGKSSGYDCILPGITVEADSLIIGCLAVTDDANDSDNITAFVNSNLSNITQWADNGTSSGSGGGISYWVGGCAGTSTGDSTATHDNTVQARFVHLGIPPSSGGPSTSVVVWLDDDMG